MSDKVRAVNALTRSGDPVGLPSCARSRRQQARYAVRAGHRSGRRHPRMQRRCSRSIRRRIYEGIVLNNRLRGTLDAALSALKLFADRATASGLGQGDRIHQPGRSPASDRKGVATETDPAIKSCLSRPRPLNLKSTDPRCDSRRCKSSARPTARSSRCCRACWRRTRGRTPSLTPKCVRRRFSIDAIAERSSPATTLGVCSRDCRSAASCCWSHSAWRSPTACSASSTWRTAKC